MKRFLAIIGLLILAAVLAFPEPVNGVVIALTTGTASRLIPTPSLRAPVKANSLFIQALHGGSNLVYVLYAPPDVVCALNGAGTTLVAELAAATASAPGGSFRFPTNDAAANAAGGTDLRGWCLSGSTGDQVAASWDLRD